MKVAITTSLGSFHLQYRALSMLLQQQGLEAPYPPGRHYVADEPFIEVKNDFGRQSLYGSFAADAYRAHPGLIAVIEALGEAEAGDSVRIIDIPEGVAWQIEDYDGREWIAEKHRTWGKEEEVV